MFNKLARSLKGMEYLQAASPVPYFNVPKDIRDRNQVSTIMLGPEGAMGAESMEHNENLVGSAAGTGALRGAVGGALLGGAAGYGYARATDYSNKVNAEILDDIAKTVNGTVTEYTLKLVLPRDLSADAQLKIIKTYAKDRSKLQDVMHEEANILRNTKANKLSKTLAGIGIGAALLAPIGAITGATNYAIGRAATMHTMGIHNKKPAELEKNGSYNKAYAVYLKNV